MPSIDDPLPTTPSITLAGAVRIDSADTLVDTDGDMTVLQVDATGALRVTGGGGGTEYTEDAVAPANPVGTVMQIVRTDTPAGVASADGDFVTTRGTNYGAVYTTLLDTSGNPVSVGGGTQYTEDAAAAANPVGTVPILVRQDTPASEVSANGDNIAQRSTAYGAAYVQIVSSSGTFVDSFGGGTQYTEGDTDATITGTAMLMEGAGNALVVAQGTAADGLLVNLGSNNDVVVSDGGGSITVDGTVNIGNSFASLTGSGSESGVLRVTIATDSSGVLSVDDGAGTLTVDDGGSSLTIDNSTLAVVGGGTEATAMRVTIASDSTGVLSIDDNGGSLTVDGTVAVTNAGTFVVQENGAALTALQLIDDAIVADDAAFTPATTKVMMAGFEYDDTTPDSVNEGDAGAARMSANRNIYMQIRDAAGNERGVNVNASNQMSVSVDNTVTVASHAVTNAGTFAVQESGSALTALQLIDDGIATTGSAITAKGMTACGTDGTNARALKTDSSGELQIDVLTLPASTNTIEVVGDAAHDAAIAGNPVRIGGRALTSDITAVAAGDTCDLITTLLGKLVTYPFANPANTWSYAAASGGITNTTGVTIKAAAGAGIRNYITCLTVINGHASTSTDVQIRDGASGTVLWRGFAQAAGGGVREVFTVPLRGTANTLLEVACGTTGTATYVNCQGFVAAE